MTATATILVVEDKANEREALSRVLRLEGFEVVMAARPAEALEHLAEPIDLVITDLKMGAMSGIDLLQEWKRRRPQTPFIVVTAYADVDTAVEAMKRGAEDYLGKPVHPDELLILVRKCLAARRKDELLAQLQQRLDQRLGFEKIIGHSPTMEVVFDHARRAALVDSTVLILGESGTGKELIAEAIHQNSPRKDGPFVTVNMAAVPEQLIESELFGHVKGAFTGAMEARIGRFEAAHQGTLFIDEIGDFAESCQAKLLRVLENHVVTPIGSNDDRTVDVRVVAATSRNLLAMVRAGTFREDLFYRLAVVTLELPPLRARRDDIPLLISHFLGMLCEVQKKPLPRLDQPLLDFLLSYDWPGNVRQLKNCLESMLVLAPDEHLTKDNLPAIIRQQPAGNLEIPVGVSLDKIERAAVERALKECSGNRTHAAERLGISVRTLQRKLKSWGLDGESQES